MTRQILFAILLSGWIATSTDAAENEKSSDPLAEGSVWIGDAEFVKKGSKKAKWVLTISERKGEMFKGVIAARGEEGNLASYKVSGTATNSAAGQVEFITELQGASRVSFRGKLKDGEVTVVFVGTGKTGNLGGGTANLKRKE